MTALALALLAAAASASLGAPWLLIAFVVGARLLRDGRPPATRAFEGSGHETQVAVIYVRSGRLVMRKVGKA